MSSGKLHQVVVTCWLGEAMRPQLCHTNHHDLGLGYAAAPSLCVMLQK